MTGQPENAAASCCAKRFFAVRMGFSGCLARRIRYNRAHLVPPHAAMPNPLPLPEIKNIIYALDIVGVIACTIAATVLAKQLKLDFWGAVLVC